MRAGRSRSWLCLLLLASACGCQQLESLRQGAGSTYSKELRELAGELDRKEVERIAATKERTDQTRPQPSRDDPEVMLANHWHAAPLLDAVQLKNPVPTTSGDWLPEE